MRKYRARVPFGREIRMIQPGRTACEQCGCGLDDLHQPGCGAEECPTCGKILIGCCCQNLSPLDGEKVIVALYRQFTDLASALEATGEEGWSAAGGSSYLQHAVMRYIFDNVPDSARTEIARVFHLRFPGLVPQLQDDEGRGYYSAEQLAQALDVPLQEINERIEAMVEAGRDLATGVGRKLRKVH